MAVFLNAYKILATFFSQWKKGNWYGLPLLKFQTQVHDWKS